MRKIIFLLIAVLVLVFVSIAYAQDIDTAIGKLSNKETKQEGIKEIEQIGATTLPKLQGIANDESRERGERITAIILLGKVGNKADEKSSLRQEVRETLEYILKNDQDKFLREASAIGLGYLQDKETIPQLKEALNDEIGNVRMRSAWALAKLGDKSGKELALESIKKEDVTAQLLAVDILEEISDKDIIPILEKNMNNPDSIVWTKIHSKLAIKRIEIKELKNQERLDFLRDTLKDSQLEINRWAARELAEEIEEETKERDNALGILKDAEKDNKNEGSYSAGKVLMILLKKGKVKEDELK